MKFNTDHIISYEELPFTKFTSQTTLLMKKKIGFVQDIRQCL